MRGNDFEGNKVYPLIFKQFQSRSHLSKLDRLTPQDVQAKAAIKSELSHLCNLTRIIFRNSYCKKLKVKKIFRETMVTQIMFKCDIGFDPPQEKNLPTEKSNTFQLLETNYVPNKTQFVTKKLKSVQQGAFFHNIQVF